MTGSAASAAYRRRLRAAGKCERCRKPRGRKGTISMCRSCADRRNREIVASRRRRKRDILLCAAKAILRTTDDPVDSTDIAMAVVLVGRTIRPTIEAAVQVLGEAARRPAERLLEQGVWTPDGKCLVEAAEIEAAEMEVSAEATDALCDVCLTLHAMVADGTVLRIPG